MAPTLIGAGRLLAGGRLYAAEQTMTHRTSRHGREGVGQPPSLIIAPLP